MHRIKDGIIAFVMWAHVFGGQALEAEFSVEELKTAMESGLGTGPNLLPGGIPHEGKITMSSGQYKMLLSSKEAYEIDSVYYDNLKFIRSGVNGTVILTSKAKDNILNPLKDKTIYGDPWIGGGHGGEIVQSVNCMVDGNTVSLQTEKEIRGERIVLQKVSVLYRFECRTTFVLTPEGLEEHKELVAQEEITGLHNLYFFMHNWPSTADTWRAGYHDGSEEYGEFGKEDRTIQLSYQNDGNEQPKWIAQYDPELKIGSLLLTPKVMQGQGMIKVRNKAKYYKHYTVLPVRERIFNKGESLKYSILVRALKRENGDWTATRQEVEKIEGAQK